MLLLVVGWITFHSLFRTLSKFYLRKLQHIQNSAARIVNPVLKKCIGFLLNISQFLKQPHFISFFTLVLTSILLHIFLRTALRIVSGAFRVVVISLSFQSSTLLFINMSNSLVIVLIIIIIVGFI